MPRTCTVCSHDEHHAINVALVHRDPYRTISDRYGLSQTALKRHSKEHIPELLVKAKEASEVAEADHLLARVEELWQEAIAVLEAAKDAHDHRVVLSAIDRASRQLELLGRLRGELNEQPVFNIITHPEYVAARTLIVQALEPYQQAKEAVVRALEGGSNGRG
jgi:hypothetical protein